MTTKINLKPCLLVGCSVSRSGGVSYSRQDLGQKELEGGGLETTWQTTKRVGDVEMLKKSEALASECRRLLRQVCYPTAFGLVCPKDKEVELEQIADEIRAKIEAGNPELSGTRLSFAIVKGEISSSDQQAAEAIVKEIGGFLLELEAAILSCDAKKIRQTVAAVKGVETLLPEGQSKALASAVAAAKKAATIIVREAEKKGRAIEAVKNELDLSPIDVARVMFVEVAAAKSESELESAPIDLGQEDETRMVEA